MLCCGAGHYVKAFDDLSIGHGLAVDGYPLTGGGIADTELLFRTMMGFCADAVMHFGASTYVDESSGNLVQLATL